MLHQTSSSFFRAFSAIILLLLSTLRINSQWTAQVSGTNYDLYSVYFLNSSTGFLASNKHIDGLLPYGGEIIRTTDGGDSWFRVLYDSTFRVRGYYFFDNNTGFAVGGYYTQLGYIFKTTNSGLNWINITPPWLYTFLHNIIFLNNSTGYSGGTFGVIKTIDAGNNWTQLLTLSGGAVPVGKVFFLDVNNGFYIRDTNSVYRTTNAGINWGLNQLPNPPTMSYLRDIRFTDNITGYIVGDGGILFKTTNQGSNWILQPAPITQDLFSIFFADINTGYITTERTVLKTTNSGNNWFSVFSFPADTLFSSYFLNTNTGYVCGDKGRVYKTTTGGVIGIKPISNEVPKEFSLSQNYPNPFNPTTLIKFATAKATKVKIVLYDALGKELETLVNESLSPGVYEVSWDGTKYSSGIYFYKLLTKEFASVKKMSQTK